MRIKRMNWFVRLITFGWPDAITLAPIGIWIKEEKFDNKKIRVHEGIHWYQQLEVYLIVVILTSITQIYLLLNGIFEWWILLILIFPPLFYFIWYFIEWIIRLFKYWKILFEREAYDNDDNLDYLETRKHFAWLW